MKVGVVFNDNIELQHAYTCFQPMVDCRKRKVTFKQELWTFYFQTDQMKDVQIKCLYNLGGGACPYI